MGKIISFLPSICLLCSRYNHIINTTQNLARRKDKEKPIVGSIFLSCVNSEPVVRRRELMTHQIMSSHFSISLYFETFLKDVLYFNSTGLCLLLHFLFYRNLILLSCLFYLLYLPYSLMSKCLCRSLWFVNERQYNGHRYYTATGIIKCVNLCSWIIRNVEVCVQRYSNYFNSAGLQLNECQGSALGRNKLNTYQMKWNIFPQRRLYWECFFFVNYLDSLMIYF